MHDREKHLYAVSQDGFSLDILTHFLSYSLTTWYGEHLDCSDTHIYTVIQTPPPPNYPV